MLAKQNNTIQHEICYGPIQLTQLVASAWYYAGRLDNFLFGLLFVSEVLCSEVKVFAMGVFSPLETTTYPDMARVFNAVIAPTMHSIKIPAVANIMKSQRMSNMSESDGTSDEGLYTEFWSLDTIRSARLFDCDSEACVVPPVVSLLLYSNMEALGTRPAL